MPWIERALQYRDAINLFVFEVKDAKLPQLTESDWLAIQLVESWLASFRQATTQMSMTKTMTLSAVHATFRDLQDNLRDALTSLSADAPSGLKDGLLNAHRKLSDYYTKIDESPYLIWAACT